MRRPWRVAWDCSDPQSGTRNICKFFARSFITKIYRSFFPKTLDNLTGACYNDYRDKERRYRYEREKRACWPYDSPAGIWASRYHQHRQNGRAWNQHRDTPRSGWGLRDHGDRLRVRRGRGWGVIPIFLFGGARASSARRFAKLSDYSLFCWNFCIFSNNSNSSQNSNCLYNSNYLKNLFFLKLSDNSRNSKHSVN